MRSQNPYGRNELDARIYLGCDTAQGPRSIARQRGDSFPEREIRARIEVLRDARLMVEMEGHYLSVAVWRNRAVRELVASAQLTQVLPES